MAFQPRLDILPDSQRELWPELSGIPTIFTLYGGTALALRLGHRVSVDFDFFSNAAFDQSELIASLSWLQSSEIVQIAPNTLTCRVSCGEGVLVSFFGGLGLGQVEPEEEAEGSSVRVASLYDIAGTKAAVLQKRAEVKDYVDIDAILNHGTNLATILSAGKIVYGDRFNPLITLKALSYFGDVPGLPESLKSRLSRAANSVNPAKLPLLIPHKAR